MVFHQKGIMTGSWWHLKMCLLFSRLEAIYDGLVMEPEDVLTIFLSGSKSWQARNSIWSCAHCFLFNCIVMTRMWWDWRKNSLFSHQLHHHYGNVTGLKKELLSFSLNGSLGWDMWVPLKKKLPILPSDASSEGTCNEDELLLFFMSWQDSFPVKT